MFVNDALDRADALRTRVLSALEARMDWAVSTVEDVEILKRLLPASKAARCQEGGRASGVQLAMPCICRSGIARDF